MTSPGQSYAPLSCARLGSATDYTAVVTGVCGTGTLLVAESLTDTHWSRRLDDVSTAEVTIGVAGANDELCRALGQVEAWCHELHIYREGEEVWSGPLMQPRWSASNVVLPARDNSAWLDRQAVEKTHDLKQTDLALVAEALVRAEMNLGVDGGCLLMESTMTGIVEDRKIEKHSGYVGDALRELCRAGLSYTALGRRLVVFGSQPLALVGPLSDDDFMGELIVQQDGLDGCTRAVVIGEGVTGVYEVPGACGRVTKLVKNEQITTKAAADRAAYQLVKGGYPWPVNVQPPGSGGAQLSPEATVCVDQLVPGVAVRVFAGGTCRQFVTDMQLTAVEVQAGADTESVQVSLSPLAADGTFPDEGAA